MVEAAVRVAEGMERLGEFCGWWTLVGCTMGGGSGGPEAGGPETGMGEGRRMSLLVSHGRTL